jgi:precorrin-6B methylase 2
MALFGKRKKQNLHKEAAHKLAEADRLRRAGDLAAAEAAARGALEIDPDHRAAALAGLGAALDDQGRAEEAFDAYQQSLGENADQPLVFVALAQMCLARGRPDEALLLADKAGALAPGLTTAKIVRASVLEQLGESKAALEEIGLAYRVASRDADNIAALIAFIARKGLQGGPFRDGEAALLTAYRTGGSEGRVLAVAAGEVWSAKYAQAVQGGEIGNELLAHLAEDELFIRLLQESVNVRAGIELLCRSLRRKIMLECHGSEELPVPAARLAAALALQNHANGYVVAAGGEEANVLAGEDARLGALVAAASGGVPTAARAALLLYAMYRPLAARGDADRLLDLPFGGEAGRVVLLTVREKREQSAEIAQFEGAAGQSAAAGEDETAVTPWQHFAPPRPVSFKHYLLRRLPGIAPPDWSDGAFEILFPGAGSAREAVALALALPACRVVASDANPHALAYGARRARKLGAGNLSFAVGDGLPEGLAGRHFQFIDARHMGARGNPTEILTALAGQLAPGGLLRFDIASADHAASLRAGLESGARDAGGSIEAARAAVLGDGTGACAYLARQTEFYDLAGCRQLILRAGQGGATAAALGEAVARAGLELAGQIAPAALRARYRAQRHDDPLIRDLAFYEGFMRNHSAESGGMFRLLCRKPA